jgi:CRP-like cAMP-binding protein
MKLPALAALLALLAGPAFAADCDPRAILAGVAPLAPLGEARLSALAGKSKVLDLGTGTVLIRQGDRGDSLFALGSGGLSVRVAGRNGEREVASLGPGGLVGEFMLLEGQERTATVVAAEASCAVEIGREALSPLLLEAPEAVDALARLIAARMGAIGPEATGRIADRIRAHARETR